MVSVTDTTIPFGGANMDTLVPVTVSRGNVGQSGTGSARRARRQTRIVTPAWVERYAETSIRSCGAVTATLHGCGAAPSVHAVRTANAAAASRCRPPMTLGRGGGGGGSEPRRAMSSRTVRGRPTRTERTWMATSRFTSAV